MKKITYNNFLEYISRNYLKNLTKEDSSIVCDYLTANGEELFKNIEKEIRNEYALKALFDGAEIKVSSDCYGSNIKFFLDTREPLNIISLFEEIRNSSIDDIKGFIHLGTGKDWFNRYINAYNKNNPEKKLNAITYFTKSDLRYMVLQIKSTKLDLNELEVYKLINLFGRICHKVTDTLSINEEVSGKDILNIRSIFNGDNEKFLSLSLDSWNKIEENYRNGIIEDLIQNLKEIGESNDNIINFIATTPSILETYDKSSIMGAYDKYKLKKNIAGQFNENDKLSTYIQQKKNLKEEDALRYLSNFARMYNSIANALQSGNDILKEEEIIALQKIFTNTNSNFMRLIVTTWDGIIKNYNSDNNNITNFIIKMKEDGFTNKEIISVINKAPGTVLENCSPDNYEKVSDALHKFIENNLAKNIDDGEDKSNYIEKTNKKFRSIIKNIAAVSVANPEEVLCSLSMLQGCTIEATISSAPDKISENSLQRDIKVYTLKNIFGNLKISDTEEISKRAMENTGTLLFSVNYNSIYNLMTTITDIFSDVYDIKVQKKDEIETLAEKVILLKKKGIDLDNLVTKDNIAKFFVNKNFMSNQKIKILDKEIPAQKLVLENLKIFSKVLPASEITKIVQHNFDILLVNPDETESELLKINEECKGNIEKIKEGYEKFVNREVSVRKSTKENNPGEKTENNSENNNENSDKKMFPENKDDIKLDEVFPLGGYIEQNTDLNKDQYKKIYKASRKSILKCRALTLKLLYSRRLLELAKILEVKAYALVDKTNEQANDKTDIIGIDKEKIIFEKIEKIKKKIIEYNEEVSERKAEMQEYLEQYKKYCELEDAINAKRKELSDAKDEYFKTVKGNVYKKDKAKLSEQAKDNKNSYEKINKELSKLKDEQSKISIEEYSKKYGKIENIDEFKAEIASISIIPLQNSALEELETGNELVKEALESKRKSKDSELSQQNSKIKKYENDVKGVEESSEELIQKIKSLYIFNEDDLESFEKIEELQNLINNDAFKKLNENNEKLKKEAEDIEKAIEEIKNAEDLSVLINSFIESTKNDGLNK